MARLTMWQPLSDMLAYDTMMDQMMRNQPRVAARSADTRASFAVDLVENENGYILHAVMPGVNPDELQIDFADRMLTIKGESKVVEAGEGNRYHLRERTPARYERSLRFPVPINTDAIEAGYENGILTLYLPKSETVKPRRITVQSATS